eukprot:208824-Rhodomonas_salina.1
MVLRRCPVLTYGMVLPEATGRVVSVLEGAEEVGYLPNGYHPNGYHPNGYLPHGFLPTGYHSTELLTPHALLGTDVGHTLSRYAATCPLVDVRYRHTRCVLVIALRLRSAMASTHTGYACYRATCALYCIQS